MSHWDSTEEKIVRWPTKKAKGYPAWDEVDCGCCSGIQWGGEYPRECPRCGGNGVIFKHRASGVEALYPGGPFCRV